MSMMGESSHLSARETGSDLSPRPRYRHPMEVAYHAQLSAAEKRAILCSWAANAGAIEAAPLIRRDPETGVDARYDEVVDALRALDEEEARHERAGRILGKTRAAIHLAASAPRRRISRSGSQIVTTGHPLGAPPTGALVF